MASEILENLVQAKFIFNSVITQEDKKSGRKQILTPPPVKQIAEKYNLKIYQPQKIKDLEPILKEIKPDLIILIAYGQFIPENIINIPRKGILNVHPSLLPKYRGPSPIKTFLLNQEQTTGISLMLLDKDMDHGAILNQKEINIDENENSSTLITKVIDLGTKMLIETIPKWLENQIEPQEQNHEKATFTKLFTKQDGKIDWNTPAKDINAKIKAFYDWPNAYTYLEYNNKKQLFKIKNAKLTTEQSTIKPGTIIISSLDGLKKDNTLKVACQDNLLEITEIQPEGKKSISGTEFSRGYARMNGLIFI